MRLRAQATKTIQKKTALLFSVLALMIQPLIWLNIPSVFAATVTSHVVINEIFPSPSGGADEWVELYNPTASPVDVTGWKIQDSGSYKLTLTGSIGANNFLTFNVNNMNNAGDTVHLFDGSSDVDSKTYTSISSDKSYARTYDASEDWETRSTASRNTTNGSAPASYEENSVCASGCEYTNLADAVDGEEASATLEIRSDTTVTRQAKVTKAVTIHGNGFTVNTNYNFENNSVGNAAIGIVNTADVTITNVTIDGINGTGLHGINIFGSTGVQLTDVTSKNNDKSGVSVNGSTVTVTNISTAGNGYHGVNADKTGTVLMVKGTSTHSEVFADIYVDDDTLDVTVNDVNMQYDYAPSGISGRDHDRVYRLKPATPACSSDDTTFDTFNNGSVNGQKGWQSTGNYDQSVVYNTYGYDKFGCKSLRISNARTQGSFSDQTFSYSTPNESGEASAENGGYSGGDRMDRFTARWDFASTTKAEQSGLGITASPDRGDGARMSWIRMEDRPDGMAIGFYDYQKNQNDFVYTDIATGLNYTTTHNVKVVIDFKDGSDNDVVKVYVDGELKHTGNSWEDYFRDSEGNPTRTIDSLLYRASGTAAPATAGNGYLIDNVEIATSMRDTTKPNAHIDTPTNGSVRGSSVQVQGTASDTDSGIDRVEYTVTKISAIGGSFVGNFKSGTANYNAGNFNFDVTGMTNGFYRVKAQAFDREGNNRYSNYIDIESDTTKPNATITTPVNGLVQSSKIMVAGTASDTHSIDQVKYTVTEITGIGGTYVRSVENGTADYEDGTFGFNLSGLDGGYYRIKIQAFDTVGNWRYKYVDVRVDVSKPTVVIMQPTNGETKIVSSFSVDGTASDVDSNITSVKYTTTRISAIGGTYQESIANGEAAYDTTTNQFTFNVLGVSDGFYRLKVQAFDQAGNWRYKYVDVIVSTTDSNDDDSSTGSSSSGSNTSTNRSSNVGNTTSTTTVSPQSSLVVTAVGNSSNLRTTNPSSTTNNDDGDTLGTSDKKGDSNSGDVLAATDEKDNTNWDGNVFGVSWYWWLVTLGVLGAGAWWLLGVRRRRREDAAL